MAVNNSCGFFPKVVILLTDIEVLVRVIDGGTKHKKINK